MERKGIYRYCRLNFTSSQREFDLLHLSRQSGVLLFSGSSFLDHLFKMVLGILDLPCQLLFELLKVSTFQRGLECKPKIPPEPLLSDHVAPDGMLSHKQAPLVVPQPFVDPPGIVGTNDTLSRKDCWSDVFNSKRECHLHHGHQIIDAVVTDLLHETKDASTEEDLGVTILEYNRFE